jgi:hypothetical protein
LYLCLYLTGEGVHRQDKAADKEQSEMEKYEKIW